MNNVNSTSLWWWHGILQKASFAALQREKALDALPFWKCNTPHTALRFPALYINAPVASSQLLMQGLEVAASAALSLSSCVACDVSSWCWSGGGTCVSERCCGGRDITPADSVILLTGIVATCRLYLVPRPPCSLPVYLWSPSHYHSPIFSCVRIFLWPSSRIPLLFCSRVFCVVVRIAAFMLGSEGAASYYNICRKLRLAKTLKRLAC